MTNSSNKEEKTDMFKDLPDMKDSGVDYGEKTVESLKRAKMDDSEDTAEDLV